MNDYVIHELKMIFGAMRYEKEAFHVAYAIEVSGWSCHWVQKILCVTSHAKTYTNGFPLNGYFRTGKRERHYGLRNNSKRLWNVDAENSFTAWLSFRMDTLFVSFAAERPKFLVHREHSLQSSLKVKLKETQTRKSK